MDDDTFGLIADETEGLGDFGSASNINRIVEDEDEDKNNQVAPPPLDEHQRGEGIILSAPRSKIPVMRNVICNINCGVKLNILQLAMTLKNAEFNPKKFPAATFKLDSPKTTNLIFPVGKICTVGSKSEEDGRLALRKIVRILQKVGYKNARFQNFRIQNILAKTDIGFPIRLEGLAYAHSKFCRYEPEIFPGLVYRMAAPSVCLLIFVSGRIVFTGAKDRDDIYQAYENIYNVLLAFQQRSNQDPPQQLSLPPPMIPNDNSIPDDDSPLPPPILDEEIEGEEDSDIDDELEEFQGMFM